MADWKERSQIDLDVVYFDYSSKKKARSQNIFLWDLDKTYLDTKFETIKGLFKTVFEKSSDKKNIPGTSELVRSLKKVHLTESENFPLFFITASPPQLEKKIREKLVLDDIEPFGIFFKDNMQNLHPQRFRRLKKQIGYKLHALMILRTQLPENINQFLWGDDSEADAIIYSIYSDICSRRLSVADIRRFLKKLSVTDNQINKIMLLQENVPKQDPVARFYINLEEDTDAEYYIKFGRRCLPTYNTFQAAMDLFQMNLIGLEHLSNVATILFRNFSYYPDELEKSIDDLVRRKVLGHDALGKILETLQSSQMIHNYFEPSMEAEEISVNENGIITSNSDIDPWVPERIDYLHDYR